MSRVRIGVIPPGEVEHEIEINTNKFLSLCIESLNRSLGRGETLIRSSMVKPSTCIYVPKSWENLVLEEIKKAGWPSAFFSRDGYGCGWFQLYKEKRTSPEPLSCQYFPEGAIHEVDSSSSS